MGRTRASFCYLLEFQFRLLWLDLIFLLPGWLLFSRIFLLRGTLNRYYVFLDVSFFFFFLGMILSFFSISVINLSTIFNEKQGANADS